MRFQLGLIHDHRPPAVPDLALFATRKLPAPAAKVDPPECQWPMADNDRLGCCAIAGGPVHGEQAWSRVLSIPWTYQGDQATEECYFSLTGGQDTGLQLVDVMNHWRGGLLGSTIDVFAPVHPRNTTAVQQAIDYFGVAYIGVMLPAVAQEQFQERKVWELTGTMADYQIEGGHCILPVGYDEQGNVVAVTWGDLVTITPSWWATYVSQCYAIIPKDFEARGGDARGIDIATLRQTIDSLGAAA